MSVHLMVRSCYSLLNSTIRISELAEQAKLLGYDSIALTDRNVLFGAAEFEHACKKAGIRPIFGLELDVLVEGDTVPFLLLAKTNSGFSNLSVLSSLYMEKEEAVPFEEFVNWLSGLHVIVYGEEGWMDSALLNDNRQEILEKLSWLKERLPAFDAAVSYQESGMWKIKNRMFRQCAASLGIPSVAVNKIYYLKEEDAKLYRMLKAIRLQRSLNDTSLPLINGRWMLSKEEMEELYAPEDLARTDEIAAMCHATSAYEKTGLPSYEVPPGLTSIQVLTQLCLAGLNKRTDGAMPAEYRKRLSHELDIIGRMQFADYFLIVYDFIKHARKQGIYVGPGRGSAAGSLVSYCLGITMVDPIRYQLLFERFLNPSRVTMPDIDTDIPDNRRQDVIRYVREKYGNDHTANIITFNTLGAKQVLRDLGRAMNIPSRDVDMLCRMIPSTPGITLRAALNENARLREIVSAEDRYRQLFKAAARLEGLPRHRSINAAGIIMSSRPLREIIPLCYEAEGTLTSQYAKDYLEERGLIKMDFLGLRNLTMIDSMVQRIRQERPDFDIMKISLQDSNTIALFRRADTNGVFQFESEGMKSLLKRISPDCFEDVVAALALYRPASVDSIPIYLSNKKNPMHIRYPSSELEPVLRDTYGVMIYQEQSMLTAEIAAGFTLAEADTLRKAMSKKKEQELLNMKEAFIQGCIRNGYAKEKAKELFDLVQKFGGYGFNKSHAVAYGLVAWQTAWLKANHPYIFYSCLFDGSLGDHVRISQYMDECRRKNITVLGPDVNESASSCIADGKKIRLPLSIVRGIGMNASEAIVQEREKGKFTDFFEFVARVMVFRISRANIESLIDAGALDCFRETRTTMKQGLEEASAYAELIRIESNGQISIHPELVSRPILTRRYDEPSEIRENELNALGFTLGPDPIVEVRKKYSIHVPPLAQIAGRGGVVQGFARIASIRPYTTKRGERMAFLKGSDETADLDLLVMPRTFLKYESILRKGMYVLFDGKMEETGKCIVNQMKEISGKEEQNGKTPDS